LLIFSKREINRIHLLIIYKLSVRERVICEIQQRTSDSLKQMSAPKGGKGCVGQLLLLTDLLANICFAQTCWSTAVSYRHVGHQLLPTDVLANSWFPQMCWPTADSHRCVGQQLLHTDVLANSYFPQMLVNS